jgi:biopolymer transport protein ExbD
MGVILPVLFIFLIITPSVSGSSYLFVPEAIHATSQPTKDFIQITILQNGETYVKNYGMKPILVDNPPEISGILKKVLDDNPFTRPTFLIQAHKNVKWSFITRVLEKIREFDIISAALIVYKIDDC